jgi:hypothetical protein
MKSIISTIHKEPRTKKNYKNSNLRWHHYIGMAHSPGLSNTYSPASDSSPFMNSSKNNTVDKFGSPKSPMGWGLKRLENLIQDPLENPTTSFIFDELRRIGHHIGLLMMIHSTSTSLVSA